MAGKLVMVTNNEKQGHLYFLLVHHLIVIKKSIMLCVLLRKADPTH